MGRAQISGKYRLLISLLLSLSLLTSCANVNQNTSTHDPLKPNKDFANKQLNVAVFEGGQGKDYWLEVKDRFEKDYPGVEVSLTISPKILEMIKPQIVSGNPPDLIYASPDEVTGTIQAMIRDKMLLDLTDVFETNALDTNAPLKDKFIDDILAYTKPLGDGKIYIAPFYTSPMGLIYNQSLFKKKGWELPETWDDFMALGELAKEEGRSLFTYQGINPGYNESIFWPSVATSGGMEAIWKAGNLEPEAFKTVAVRKTMEIFDEIAEKDYLMPGSVALNHMQAQTEFIQGKALFIPCGTWIENEMAGTPREEDFEFAFLAPPVFNKGDQRYVMTFVDGLFIPAKSKNIELAKEFLRYQYRDDIILLNSEKSKGILAVKNGAEIAKPFISPFLYNAMRIFNDGVKPIIFKWKPTPKSTLTKKDTLFYPIAHIMNRTMTVEQWQEHVEVSFGKLRELMKDYSH